jgi:hypothetical protein
VYETADRPSGQLRRGPGPKPRPGDAARLCIRTLLPTAQRCFGGRSSISDPSS